MGSAFPRSLPFCPGQGVQTLSGADRNKSHSGCDEQLLGKLFVLFPENQAHKAFQTCEQQRKDTFDQIQDRSFHIILPN